MSYTKFQVSGSWQESFMGVILLPTTDCGLSYYRLASSIVHSRNKRIYKFDTRLWDPDKATQLSSNDVSVPIARSLPEVKIKHSI